MSRGRQSILGAVAGVGIFLLVGGGLILSAGVPYDYCQRSSSGMWGILPALVGFLTIGLVAVIAWDAQP